VVTETNPAPPAPDLRAPRGERRRAAATGWTRLVVATTAATAVADLLAMALQRSIIPPVAVGSLLSLAALGLLRWRERAGLITIGVLTVALILTGAPFAGPALGHPDSPIGFVHSAAYLIGRGLVLVAVFGALFSRSERAARIATTVAASTGLAILGIGTIATITRPDNTIADGDIRVDADRFDFPDVTAPTGATLFVENKDTVWHRLVIPGTDVDLDLAAGTGTRLPTDLRPGEYVLFCDITGHDGMFGHLTVTE
jgi:plastocyanin